MAECKQVRRETERLYKFDITARNRSVTLARDKRK